MCDRPVADHHGNSSRLEMELFAASYCAFGRAERSAPKAVGKAKDEIRRTKLKLSLTAGRRVQK